MIRGTRHTKVLLRARLFSYGPAHNNQKPNGSQCLPERPAAAGRVHPEVRSERAYVLADVAEEVLGLAASKERWWGSCSSATVVATKPVERVVAGYPDSIAPDDWERPAGAADRRGACCCGADDARTPAADDCYPTRSCSSSTPPSNSRLLPVRTRLSLHSTGVTARYGPFVQPTAPP